MRSTAGPGATDRQREADANDRDSVREHVLSRNELQRAACYLSGSLCHGRALPVQITNAQTYSRHLSQSGLICVWMPAIEHILIGADCLVAMHGAGWLSI